MSTPEQRDDRIAMWQHELLDLIPDSVEADLANPEDLLWCLIADVRSKALAEVAELEARLEAAEARRIAAGDRDQRRYDALAKTLHTAVLRAEKADAEVQRLRAGIEGLTNWWNQRPEAASGYDLACRDHARQLRALLEES